MASLSLRHIYKIYSGGVKAVSDFNLEIEDKEFIVFVGPSGCGKSTTLRMVAGLEEITAGELYIDGKLVNDVEPKDRDIAMVFQNYALYPHMTVYENMAFGLKLRKVKSEEIKQRVNEAANILGITPLLSRKPKALSGGQRQRVALGRAIVREPKVFLLDEPLSNLDAKLRVQMRTEITKLHNRLATTFIYVTHDQTEAMTMGTRIVVMKDGIVQQVDTPQYLYDSPDNKFVASFLGSPQMNFFEKTILSKERGRMYAVFGENRIEIPNDRARRLIDEGYLGKEITMGIRPEDIHDEEIFISSSPKTIIKARIDVMEKLGNETLLYMEVDGKPDYTIARVDARTSVQQGETLELAVDAHHLHFFDNKTELTIMGVPRYNMFDVKLLEQSDGTLSVNLGGAKVTLPQGIRSRLVNAGYIGKTVKLGIAPDSLMDEAGTTVKKLNGFDGQANFSADSLVEVNATSEFSEPYPKFNAVYSKVKGKNTFMVTKHALDESVAEGTQLKFFVTLDDIVLIDAVSGEIIIGSRDVSDNTVTATVAVKGDAATVSFGKIKLTVDNAGGVLGDGTYPVKLLPHVDLTKEGLAAGKSRIISGVVEGIDELGETYILYLRVAGIEPYFTAIAEGRATVNIGDKVKVALRSDCARKVGHVYPEIDPFAQIDEPVSAVEDAPAAVEEAPAVEDAPAEPSAKAPAKTTTKAKSNTAKSTTAKSTTAKSTTAKSTTTKSTTAKSTASKSTAAKTTTTKTAAKKPAAKSNKTDKTE